MQKLEIHVVYILSIKYLDLYHFYIQLYSRLHYPTYLSSTRHAE